MVIAFRVSEGNTPMIDDAGIIINHHASSCINRGGALLFLRRRLLNDDDPPPSCLTYPLLSIQNSGRKHNTYLTSRRESSAEEVTGVVSSRDRVRPEI